MAELREQAAHAALDSGGNGGLAAVGGQDDGTGQEGGRIGHGP
jgi:hypothetical protein